MKTHSRRLLDSPFLLTCALLVLAPVAQAQITGGVDRNLAKMAGDQTECAIAKNPLNKLQLFASCNNDTAGLFAARSIDGGVSWIYPDPADKTLADGDPMQGPAAWSDPTLSWDTFGNLFFGYIDQAKANIVLLVSIDNGSSFTTVTTFGPAGVDQPTVTADAGAVWLVWNESGQMVARGAPVTGLGVVGAFGAKQTIPGAGSCNYGDVAISPAGAVVQVCETPTGGQGASSIRVNTDADGLGAGNFNAGVVATSSNVGGFDYIPAQNIRSTDAEPGLAYDRNPMSPHFGRLYLVYAQETVDESNDLDVMVRFSDNDGGMWSAPIKVNDDATTRSQFMPKIASNRLSGNIAVCWYDCRASATNTAMRETCSIATPAGATPTFFTNVAIGDGASTSNGSLNEWGDYSGLAYFQGLAHPIWGDLSNSTGDNPGGTAGIDAYSDRVSGGMAANEGDPHITTVEGVHYDFQPAGEFVVLRDADGMQIQTRQTAVPTTFFPGPNAYTGIASCVSLNTAVAAQVGKRRVTFEPNLSGVPDPNGLQLRIDGALTVLPPGGISFGADGRIASSPGGGIDVEFPGGTRMVVTPNFWTSQGYWYLNVNVPRTPAQEGIMGALAPGSWLPALPNGTSLGPRPVPLHQRYLDLNRTFADAWRVSDKTSLFDYAPGTSTATFTVAGWPKENPPCTLPKVPAVKPLSLAVAQSLCREVKDRARKANCIFDVRVLGERGFAKLYLLTERIEREGGRPKPQ